MSDGDDSAGNESGGSRGSGGRDSGRAHESGVADDGERFPEVAGDSESVPGSGAGGGSTDGDDPGDGFVVPTETGTDAETAWRRELAERGELTPDAVDALISRHDDRGARAVEAVSEGRVKRYRDFTVVVGHEDEYVVEDGGCTCKDSAYNLDPEDPTERCWHVLAVAIAERIGEVDHHEMWYSEVRDFL
ncbi:hypothetical protein [Halobellus rarus]|uniref:SWIM-type domain-containing protein n=1 Tax=Halobellus rarus TaxID=1126237 RepID=A0ABD6CNF9_9EURY